VSDIDLKVISVVEKSNKFQKTRLWKENPVENMVTLGPMNGTSHISLSMKQGSLFCFVMLGSLKPQCFMPDS